MIDHRNLRVSISLAGGTASVLLAVLWLRSHWYYDQLIGPDFAGGVCVCNSAAGIVLMAWTNERPLGIAVRADWTRESAAMPNALDGRLGGPMAFSRPSLADPLYSKQRFLPVYVRFPVNGSRRYTHVILPYPFLFVVASTAAAVPWLKRRFTMRTMFIGVALVAVFLRYCIILRRDDFGKQWLTSGQRPFNMPSSSRILGQ